MSRTGQDQFKAVKTSWHLAVTLALLALTAACSATGPTLPTQTSPSSSAPQGLIAYVGNDGNIYTINGDGKQKTAVTQDANFNAASDQVGRIYQYPTWAPDGKHLAFMSFARSDPGTQANLITALWDGSQRVSAFSSQDTLPFYLFWSPNSQTITFLTDDTGGAGLALYMASAAGGDSKVVGTGNPYYWDWSPDNRALIVHTGGAVSDNPDARLDLVELDDPLKINQLDLKPGDFQTPAWSPAGDELALSTQNAAGQAELVLAGRDGKLKQTLAQLSGPATFAWSPKGSRLAYTTQVQLDAGPVIRLALLDTSQPNQSKEIVQGGVVAFFWAPDGQKIAYFSIANQAPGGTALISQSTQTSPPISLAVQVV